MEWGAQYLMIQSGEMYLAYILRKNNTKIIKQNKKKMFNFVFFFPFSPVVIAEKLLFLFILLMV